MRVRVHVKEQASKLNHPTIKTIFWASVFQICAGVVIILVVKAIFGV